MGHLSLFDLTMVSWLTASIMVLLLTICKFSKGLHKFVDSITIYCFVYIMILIMPIFYVLVKFIKDFRNIDDK